MVASLWKGIYLVVAESQNDLLALERPKMA